jgi:hypothetical protein
MRGLSGNQIRVMLYLNRRHVMFRGHFGIQATNGLVRRELIRRPEDEPWLMVLTADGQRWLDGFRAGQRWEGK